MAIVSSEFNDEIFQYANTIPAIMESKEQNTSNNIITIGFIIRNSGIHM